MVAGGLLLTYTRLEPEQILDLVGTGVYAPILLSLTVFVFAIAYQLGAGGFRAWLQETALDIGAVLAGAGTAFAALAAAGLVPPQGLVTLVGIIAAVLFIAKLPARFFEDLPKYLGSRGGVYAIYLLLLGGGYFFLVRTSTLLPGSEALIVLGAILPLLNGVFDWVSIGLTRYCLRQGVRPGGWGAMIWSRIDLASAVLIFLVLLFSTILVIHVVRDPTGAQLFDLRGELAEIEQCPQNFWWLYITFFTTLLPTLVHMAIASFSLIALGSGRVQAALAWGVRSIEDRDGMGELFARCGLPILATASILMPFVALMGFGFLVASNFDNIRPRLLEIIFWFSGALDPTYVDPGAQAGAAERCRIASGS